MTQEFPKIIDFISVITVVMSWARAVEPRADDDATAVAIRLLDALLTAHHGWSRAAGEPLLLRYALPRDAGSVTIDAVTVFDDLVLRRLKSCNSSMAAN